MSEAPITHLNAALEGRYRIERELGAGGMATVYLAEDVRHGRKVALKVLEPELAAIVGAERFLAEIRTTANLQHPHILPLFDSGEAGGFLFYVMPFVEGESLRDKLDREKQLPVEEAVGIAASVAEALEYAHGHGVIHRDIKPANILLQAGRPVVSDFGIAVAVGVAGGGRLTETGLSLGTPHHGPQAGARGGGRRRALPRRDRHDREAPTPAHPAAVRFRLGGRPPLVSHALSRGPPRPHRPREAAPCRRGARHRASGLGGSAGGGLCHLVRRGASSSESWISEADTMRVLLDEVTRTWHTPTGHLMYVRSDGGVLAAPFDLDGLALEGPGIPLFEGVSVNVSTPELAVARDDVGQLGP